MKNILRYLVLSPLILCVSGCSTTPASSESSSAPSVEPPSSSSVIPDLGPVDVVLISGQSNAVGCTYCDYLFETMGSDKYAEYSNGYPSIQIAYDCWTKDYASSNPSFSSQNSSRRNNFVDVALGQGNSTRTFGPEIGIAEAMHEKYANKLFLIKYACGASNLKEDWMKRNSPMYGPFIDYVKKQIGNLKQKGYSPTIKAFCWMQGEGDAYPELYQSYQDNLRRFVGYVREDLRELSGNKDVPFIDAGISSAELWQYYRQINEAKAAFAAESENNYFIDTIAAGLHTDQEPETVDYAHYDSESQIQLGHLFAEAFEPFLGD